MANPAPTDARCARRTGWVVVAAFAAGITVVFGTVVGCASMGTDGTTDEALVEALEDQATMTPAPTPTSTPTPEPLVTTSPDGYSEVGDLVDGFPIDLLLVPSDAVILVTSAVPVGDAAVEEVSLNLRTAATADELLTLYRTSLTVAGFSEVTSQTSNSDLAVDVTFVRSDGDELISIGVLDVDGARTLTIGGRVRTAD